MLTCFSKTRAILLCLMSLMIGLSGSRDSTAGKPGGGGGGVPAGRIFYTWGSEYGAGGGPPYFQDRGDWSMNSDGSDKRQTYVPRNDADLSHFLHQGHRWFLVSDWSLTHPGFGALFAARDDGNPAYSVQLVDSPQWMRGRWGQDDSLLSFVTHNAIDNADEIWACDVAFDVETGLPFLAAPPILVVTELNATIGRHDFSPLGDEVVYHVSAEGADALLVKDLNSGITDLLIEHGEEPIWSPDGTNIAFHLPNVGIHVIHPNGTGLLTLTSSTWGDYLGDWSVDSKHIVFSRQLRKGSIWSSDVMRVPVAGGTTVNLTKDIDGTAGALAWR